MSRLSLGFTLATAFSLAACLPVTGGEGVHEELPVNAPSVTLTANARVDDHITGVTKAAMVFGGSAALDGASGALCPEPTEEVPEPECDTDEAEWYDLSEAGTSLREWLNENAFNDDSIESSTETSVTYRLFPETMCPVETDEHGMEARDAQCVQFFTDLPVRLRATSPAEDDLDVAITVGDYPVAQLELYTTHVSVQADLDTIKSVVNDAAPIFEEDIDFVKHLSGVVKLTLTRHAETDYSLALAIIEAVHVGINDADHDEYVDVKLGVAADAASIRLTPETGFALGQLGLSNIDVAAALELLVGGGEDCDYGDGNNEPVCTTPAAKEGVISAALAGLTGAGSFHVDNEMLTLTDVGIGNAKAIAKLDDTQIATLVINPTTNGLFDVLAESLNDGTQLRIDVAPSLSVTVEHTMVALIDALGDDGEDIPVWMKAGESSISTGETGAALLYTEAVEAPYCAENAETCEPGEDEVIQIVEGTVTLSAAGVPDVVLSAPQCAVYDANGEAIEGQHIFANVTGEQCE